LFLICFLQTAIAQTYHPDKMLVNGINQDYRYHHMELYFNHYPEKRPIANKDSTIMTRGYIAEYEINNNVLYLNDIKTPVNGNYNNLVSNSRKVISPKEKNLKMYWVNGLYDVGLGEARYQNPNDTLIPIYDNYLIFEIERGTITRTNTFTYKQYKTFKDYQWEFFRNTDAYTKLYQKLMRTGMDAFETDQHIYYHILFYSKRNFLKK